MSFSTESGYGDAWRDRILTVRFRDLDWEGGDAQAMLDAYLSIHPNPDVNGMVLDLRDTKGYSAITAARIAARFIKSGELLRYRRSETFEAVIFTVEGGHLYQRIIDEITDLGSVAHYDGKLVVQVDGGTDGVAVALAHVLYASGRASASLAPTPETTTFYARW